MMAFLATAPGPARREEPTGRSVLLRMASLPLLLGVLLMVAAGAASVLSITREEPSFALTSRLWDLAGLNRLFRSIECLPKTEYTPARWPFTMLGHAARCL